MTEYGLSFVRQAPVWPSSYRINALWIINHCLPQNDLPERPIKEFVSVEYAVAYLGESGSHHFRILLNNMRVPRWNLGCGRFLVHRSLVEAFEAERKRRDEAVSGRYYVPLADHRKGYTPPLEEPEEKKT